MAIKGVPGASSVGITALTVTIGYGPDQIAEELRGRLGVVTLTPT